MKTTQLGKVTKIKQSNLSGIIFFKHQYLKHQLQVTGNCNEKIITSTIDDKTPKILDRIDKIGSDFQKMFKTKFGLMKISAKPTVLVLNMPRILNMPKP